MIRTKLAKKVLTKKEQKHLTECGITSLRGMIEQVKYMEKLCPEDPGSVCRECRHIAFKLNLL